MENNIVELKIRSRFSRIIRFPIIFYKHYKIAHKSRGIQNREAIVLAFRLAILTVRKIPLTF